MRRRSTIAMWLMAVLCLIAEGSAIPRQEPDVLRLVEIYLTNESHSSITVKVEAIGFIFNDLREYSLTSSASKPGAPNEPITGDMVTVQDGADKWPIADHIGTTPESTVDRHIGYGMYRMNVEDWGSIYIDWSDWDYPDGYGGYDAPYQDLYFRLTSNNSLLWENRDGSHSVQLSRYETIEVWDQDRIGEGGKSPKLSDFIVPSSVATIPLDRTDEVVDHLNPGELRVEVDVEGDISVADGKAFEPKPASKLFFATGKELSVEGSLVAEGNASDPIAFDRQGSSGTWGGIVFNSGSGGTVAYATIRHATKGISVWSASPTLQNNSIEDFSEQGVYACGNTSVVVEGCTIGPASGASHGVFLTSKYSTPSVINNTIQGITCGIERETAPGAAELAGNTITDCGDGIRAYLSTPEIFDNYIHDNAYGIRLKTSSVPDIHDNDLYHNDTGVYLEQSEPSRLKWNNFGYTAGQMLPNEDWGLKINSLSAGNDFADYQANNFYDGWTTRDVRNYTATTFMVRGSYWEDQVIVGSADASDPLGSPNSDAGPGGELGKLAQAGWQTSEQAVDAAPVAFRVEPNFPNPFNPSTAFRFVLPAEASVTLTIYDVRGCVVRRLLAGRLQGIGLHEAVWDGRGEAGDVVASGVYFYRLEASGGEQGARYSATGKLVFMR